MDWESACGDLLMAAELDPDNAAGLRDQAIQQVKWTAPWKWRREVKRLGR